MKRPDRAQAERDGDARATFSRRGFLKLTGAGAALAGGAFLLGDGGGKLAQADVLNPPKYLQLVGTDGFVSMPDQAAAVDAIWPDNMAPAARNLYVFGFANPQPGNGKFWVDQEADLVGWDQLAQLRGHAELSAPVMWFDENDDVRIRLWNLGLSQRPDLLDAHTIHWHGFPNQIPYFDGVPDSSLSVPIGRNLWYRFLPRNPGTYMYHCHVEDVEHVHMGLTGVVFVRPSLNMKLGGTYVFNDPSTRYDREFAFILTEADVRDHYNDSHKVENDFTDFSPTFGLMNGRGYPDTLDGNRTDYMPGNALTAGDNGRLRNNPWSSLLQGNAGETVLLRFANLGFQEHSMTLDGLEMRVVGRDAKQLTTGRPGYVGGDPRADISYRTDRVELGPGESRDVLIEIPSGISSPQRFAFYDRSDRYAATTGTSGTPGGMRTELRVYPSGTLPSQSFPHQSFKR